MDCGQATLVVGSSSSRSTNDDGGAIPKTSKDVLDGDGQEMSFGWKKSNGGIETFSYATYTSNAFDDDDDDDDDGGGTGAWV